MVLPSWLLCLTGLRARFGEHICFLGVLFGTYGESFPAFLGQAPFHMCSCFPVGRRHMHDLVNQSIRFISQDGPP